MLHLHPLVLEYLTHYLANQSYTVLTLSFLYFSQFHHILILHYHLVGYKNIYYFIKNVIDTQNDKDDFHVISFDNELPAVDVCCVYVDEFLSAATHKFIEMITSNKVGD